MQFSINKKGHDYGRKEKGSLHDSKSSPIIQQVRAIFLSGRKVTAKDINAETNSNDARRVISTLRNNEGWNIKDVRLDDNRKLYWLESDKRQMFID